MITFVKLRAILFSLYTFYTYLDTGLRDRLITTTLMSSNNVVVGDIEFVSLEREPHTGHMGCQGGPRYAN